MSKISPIKEGYLVKKGKKRWFTLTNEEPNVLYWFDKQTSCDDKQFKSPNGSLVINSDVAISLVSEKDPKKPQYHIKLLRQNKEEYILQASGEDEMNGWFNKLQASSQSFRKSVSYGNNLHVPGLAVNGNEGRRQSNVDLGPNPSLHQSQPINGGRQSASGPMQPLRISDDEIPEGNKDLKILMDSIKKMEESGKKKPDIAEVLAVPGTINRVQGLLNHLDAAVKDKDSDVQYSILEELFDIFGIEDAIPKIKISGMESTGKSTLVEALLGFPISYSALQRATVAPTLIRLRKNTEVPTAMKYRCSLYHPKIAPLVESHKMVLKDFPIHEVSSKMELVMEYIKKTMFFSFEPVELIIESCLPNTRSISFIDLPGVIESDTVNKDEATKKFNEVGLFKITQYVVDNNYKNDLVIVVASMRAPPSHNRLFDRMDFARKDPSGQNLIPVVTSFDYYKMSANKPNEGKVLLGEWQNYYNGQFPYFLALHVLDKDSNIYGTDPKTQFENKATAIARQLEAKEVESVSWIEKPLPEMKPHLDHFKFSALKAELDRRRNAVFQQNATKIISRLEGRVEQLKDLIEAKKIELAEAKENSIETILNELSDVYVSIFQNLYQGIPFKGALDVIDQYECTWEREKQSFGNVNWPGDAHTSIMKDPSICYKPTIDEKLISSCTFMNDMSTATGVQRMDRLKSYLALKVTSIELTDPSDTFVNAHLTATPGFHGLINPENAIGKMVATVSKEIFTERAAAYITHLVTAILNNHTEYCIQALIASNMPKHRKLANYLKDNKVFTAAFRRRVDTIIRKVLVGHAITQLQQLCNLMHSAVRLKNGPEIETLGYFISGMSTEDTGKLTAFERVRTLDGRKPVPDSETINTHSAQLSSTDLAKARKLFHRHFSIFRELFRFNLDAIIDSISQKIIGTIDNEEFSTAMRESIKPGRNFDLEELKKEYNWVDITAMVQKEYELLEVERNTLGVLAKQMAGLMSQVYRSQK